MAHVVAAAGSFSSEERAALGCTHTLLGAVHGPWHLSEPVQTDTAPDPWIYYPDELADLLCSLGHTYEIHCHSGRVLTG